jgi:hypothetical protein
LEEQVCSRLSLSVFCNTKLMRGGSVDMVAFTEAGVTDDSNSFGVSWRAVIAGAFVAAALSLALLALGTGIGLSVISPWANVGASASAVGWTAITWLILMQLIASSMGGYLAGRLRTKWVRVHTHEVYFRDTAHGFLVWAVGLVITAAFLTSATTSMIGGAARAGAGAVDASGPVASRDGLGSNAYFVDAMLRSSTTSSSQDNASLRGEIGLILAKSLREGGIPSTDKSYLAQVVAVKAGISESDAEQRVDEVYAQAKQAADRARKAAAHSMYWIFLALLIGAFCASFAATVGGNERDRIVAI